MIPKSRRNCVPPLKSWTCLLAADKLVKISPPCPFQNHDKDGFGFELPASRGTRGMRVLRRRHHLRSSPPSSSPVNKDCTPAGSPAPPAAALFALNVILQAGVAGHRLDGHLILS